MNKTKFADFLKNKIKEKSKLNSGLTESIICGMKGHLEIDFVSHMEKQSYIRFDPTLEKEYQIKILSGKAYLCIQKQYYTATKEWLEQNGFVLELYPSCIDNINVPGCEVVGQIRINED